MERRTAVQIMIMLLLISTSTLTINIKPAKASGTIHIRADGSVDPSTAPIQRNGDLYYFTDNIFGSITIEKNSIILDGNGYTIQGSGDEYGLICLSGIHSSVVRNVNVKYSVYGIDVYQSYDNTISGNKITASNSASIRLLNSFNNRISGNQITGLTAMMQYEGIILSGSSYNSIYENLISDMRESCIQLALSSNNNMIYRNTLGTSYRNPNGIMILASSNNVIYENTIVNNGWSGIMFDWPPTAGNKIYHNNFINNNMQIYDLSQSPNLWDDGYPSGGNYWSDYTGVDLKSGPSQDQPGSDGIGDTPYPITSDNQDRYPLMQPWTQNKGKIVLTFDAESDAEEYGQDLWNGKITTSTLNTIEDIRSSLTNRGLHATFFTQGAVFNYSVNGVRPKARDDKDFSQIIKDLHDSGNEIASHTYTHLHLEWDDNFAKLNDELQKTANEIKKATNKWPKGFRAPYYEYGHREDSPLWASLQGRYAYDSSKWYNDDPPQHDSKPYKIVDGLYEVPVSTDDDHTSYADVAAWKGFVDRALRGETVVLVFHPHKPYLDSSTSSTWSNFLEILDYVATMEQSGRLQTTTAIALASSAGATSVPPSVAISLYSSANLYVTDPLGQHVGFDPVSGTIIITIPDATYTGPGTHPQIIDIPYAFVGNYQILVVGTAVGDYTLTIEYVTYEQTITQTFTGTITNEVAYEYHIDVSGETATARPNSTSDLAYLKTFINSLPPSAFNEKIMSASKMKKTLSSKLDEVILKVQVGNYSQATDKLHSDIRAKMDGDSTARDWIIDPATQFKLCLIIDHIIESMKIIQESS